METHSDIVLEDMPGTPGLVRYAVDGHEATHVYGNGMGMGTQWEWNGNGN